MSLGHGASIVRNGLVFHYDMANTQKSWKGAPTINYYPFINGYPSFANWNAQDVIAQTIEPNIQQLYSASKIAFTALRGVNFLGAANSTTLMTFSAKVRGAGVGYLQVHQSNTIPNGGHAAVNGNSKTLTSDWQDLSVTYYLASGVGSQNVLVVLNAGANNYVDVKDVQVEFSPFATPFVAGTRSNNESIIDLTKANTITTASLSYSNDNTFSFNGTNNYISFLNPVPSNLPHTIIQWVRPASPLTDTTSTSGAGRKTPLVGPGPQWSPGYWLTARNFRVHCYTEYRDLTINWVGDTSWHQIGQIFNGTTCYHIVDGEILLGPTRTSYSPGFQSTLYVGAENSLGNSQNWNGDIGSTIIYNRALTAQEIQQNFEALRGRYGI